MFKKTLVLAALLVSVCSASSALADQCAWTERGAADAARTLVINNGLVIYEFCKFCDDHAMKKVVVKKEANGDPDLHYKKRSETGLNDNRHKYYWELMVNQAPTNIADSIAIDLAYSYIKTGPNTYANLSALTSCPSVDVDPFVDGTGKRIDPISTESRAQ